MPILPDDSVAVVVDKGTLDALHGDQHKLDMLRERARVLDVERGGILVSISFPAAAASPLLERAASETRTRPSRSRLCRGRPQIRTRLGVRRRVAASRIGRYRPQASTSSGTTGTGISPSTGRGDARRRRMRSRRRCSRACARIRARLIEDEPPMRVAELKLFDASDSWEARGSSRPGVYTRSRKMERDASVPRRPRIDAPRRGTRRSRRNDSLQIQTPSLASRLDALVTTAQCRLDSSKVVSRTRVCERKNGGAPFPALFRQRRAPWPARSVGGSHVDTVCCRRS